MSPLLWFCLWVLIAAAIGLAPRRFHWRGAIGLMLTGLPLLVWIYYEHGALWTMGAFVGMASFLRWPGLFLIRRVGRLLGGGQ